MRQSNVNVNVTLYDALLERSNQGKWHGWGMWYA